jgi:hypothetical protein
LKLKVFRKEKVNFNVPFPACGLLHKDRSANVSFPSVFAIEILDSWLRILK